MNNSTKDVPKNESRAKLAQVLFIASIILIIFFISNGILHFVNDPDLIIFNPVILITWLLFLLFSIIQSLWTLCSKTKTIENILAILQIATILTILFPLTLAILSGVIIRNNKDRRKPKNPTIYWKQNTP